MPLHLGFAESNQPQSLTNGVTTWSATSRWDFLWQLGALGGLAFSNGRAFAAEKLPPGLARLVEQFVIEALPEGGVDRDKSIWQKRGRGAAVGGKAFEGGIDPRYFRFE